MNTRYVLPAWLFALCAIAGCSQPAEVPFTDGAGPDEPKGSGLPQAPAPRVKKTTAELLVGTWHGVSIDGQQIPKEWIFVMEFMDDGSLNIFVNDQKNIPAVKMGTYKLTGDRIKLSTPANAEGPARDWSIVIKEISNSEFTSAIVLANGKEKERTVFKRATKP
ncbi:MAG: hypothetical protein J0I06_20415 [Planctomycetes bacterium]|nr:hypothetical protein [Planctomycetota bacterium]